MIRFFFPIYRSIALAIVTSFVSLYGSAQSPLHVPDDMSPVGRWVAEHPSKGGIGSWWEFRADGTLTMYFGAVVTDHIERSGDTFMMTSGMAASGRVRAKYTIVNNVLSVDTGASRPMTYSRIGAQPNAADPLIGSWRPLPPPINATGNAHFDTNNAIMHSVMSTKGALVFTADDMQYLRIPLGTFEGTWDAPSHIFHLENHSGSYSFERKDSKLILAQPPDGRETDSYLPDPVPPTASALSSTPANPYGEGAVPTADEVQHQGRTGPTVIMPKATYAVEPSFTDVARVRKVGGIVRIQLVVQENGEMRDAHVVKSAADSYASEDDRDAARTLDQKALKAVSQYRFIPGTSSGRPVPLPVTVEVTFRTY